MISIRLPRLPRRLSQPTAMPRDARPCGHRRLPCHPTRPGTSQRHPPFPRFRCGKAARQGCGSGVVADLPRTRDDRKGRPLAPVTACRLVFSPPYLRPIRRPRLPSAPPFCPQTESRALRFLIHHHALLFAAIAGQSLRHSRPPCRPIASSDCRASRKGHSPAARRTTPNHCGL